ncbi:Zn-dependent hydrolase [Sphingomonas sp. Root710]|uniref:Zn-dependent hydrolase n=1 Tax=Sphingomonas sp. Root710 TaxID=1736594 RepID=UPI0006FF9E3E|nr:Zn-dependent hydrolase [Sphingomonas sp. Root710]KRB82922.1 Zn-dependent hydrolase [Sphingomonas sp. Root710]
MGGATVRIDRERLWSLLNEFGGIGGTAKGGVRRLAFTEEDRRARDRFRAHCEAAGMTVRVDGIGNMFARRAGSDAGLPAVMMGSHLDSQPSGGRFDGALGVLAGLEVVRALNDAGVVTRAPIELVNWSDEEGSRFGHTLLGSGVWSGVFDLSEAEGFADTDGVTVGEALERIGYRGGEAPPANDYGAYFELHIEQGPILERGGVQIGAVTGAQAQIWYDMTLTGQDSHAGTTPPAARRDALVGAARIVDLVDRLMRARGEDGRGTVGHLTVEPNSRNTVPGLVKLTIEFRHPSTEEIARIADEFSSEAHRLAEAAGLRAELAELYRIPARKFDPACVDIVRACSGRLGYSQQDMVSGAGHDAVYVSARVPTAMIFTPCDGGLSHNEAESISPDQAEAGCQVLLEAVVARANQQAA